MIVWMRRNARGIKAVLEGEAASALAAGSTMALVAMAFLAVLREGFETSVFLLAAFQNASDTTAAGAGAVLGLLAAVAIGLGLYRGGVRINLTRFFRITGLVLVFVAAGLLATAAHTAHEAGWINGLQGQAVDLSWLVQPGTITGSLLTGMLGLQPSPTVIEAMVYLLYAVPMALYVLWPDQLRLRRPPRRRPPAAGPRREPGLSPRAPRDEPDHPPPPAGVGRPRRRRDRPRRRRLPGRPGDRPKPAPRAPARSPSTASTRPGSPPRPRTASTSPPSTSTTDDRAELRELMREWSLAAAEMTAGEMVGDVNDLELAPPDDTGETVGLLPSSLTVTFGFGPGLFEKPRPRPGREAPGGAEADPAAAGRRAEPARKRRRPLRPGLLRRPPGRLPRGPQPGPDRTRHGDDALVAARLRPHLDHEPQPGHAAQPDGDEGRHRQHQRRGHRRDAAASSGSAPATGRPG